MVNCQEYQTHPLTFSSKLTWIRAKQDWLQCQSNELNRRGAIRNSTVWNKSSSPLRAIMVLLLSIKSSHLANNDFDGGNNFTFSQKCEKKQHIQLFQQLLLNCLTVEFYFMPLIFPEKMAPYSCNQNNKKQTVREIFILFKCKECLKKNSSFGIKFWTDTDTNNGEINWKHWCTKTFPSHLNKLDTSLHNFDKVIHFCGQFTETKHKYHSLLIYPVI